MRVLTTFLVFALLQSGLEPQQDRPPRQDDRTSSASFDEPLIKVRLFTLSSELGTLGGRRVHVPDLRIGEIVSAQAFVVRMRSRRDSPRGLVLMQTAPVRPMVEGVEIEVVGRAFTLAGASVELGWPEELTVDAVQAFDGVPVIAADVVRTGNVELYRLPSSKSSTTPAAARK